MSEPLSEAVVAAVLASPLLNWDKLQQLCREWRDRGAIIEALGLEKENWQKSHKELVDEIKAKDRRIAELEQIAQARFETMTELTNANCDLQAWADRVQEAAKPFAVAVMESSQEATTTLMRAKDCRALRDVLAERPKP